MTLFYTATRLALALTLQAGDPDSLERTRVVGPLGAAIDARLERFAAYGFSGAVLVVRDRRIVLSKGYGYADAEHGVRNSAATRFEMNSINKMFTAAGVLRLWSDGRLRLSDSVGGLLGGFPREKQAATVEQLAHHTSGLVVAGTTLRGDSRDAFVEDVRRTPQESPAGTRYRYTNAGYSLLAAIIERVTSRPYEEWITTELLKPAGMRTVTFRDRVPATDPRFAHGYVGSPSVRAPGPPNPYDWGTRGAGGIYTTVGDIYRWIVAIEDGRVLSPPAKKILFTPAPPPSQEAYGWHVGKDAAGREFINKGGGSDDFATQVLYYPADKVVIVWASNDLRQRWRRTLNADLPSLVFNEPVDALPTAVAASTRSLEVHAGNYLSGRDTTEVRVGSGYLYLLSTRKDVPTAIAFYPQGNGTYLGFDPAARETSSLSFPSDGSLMLNHSIGRRAVPASQPSP